MSQQISLKQAERKVFASALGDGLWDILIGCVILMFAIGPFLGRSLGDFWSSAVFVPFWALAYLVAWLIRRHVVRPRIGVVRFGSWRKARLTRFSMVMLVVCLLTFALGLVSGLRFGATPDWVPTVSFVLSILSGFGLAATLLDSSCLYIYGALIALSPLAGEWLYRHLNVPHHGYPVTFGISAGVPILVGLAKLIRLIRAYPIPSQEPYAKEMPSG